jgi:hypothetical protein
MLTEVEYWNVEDVTYHICNDAYDIGDKITVARLAGTAGVVTICMDGGDFLIAGLRADLTLDIRGDFSIKLSLHKAGADIWTVFALGS